MESPLWLRVLDGQRSMGERTASLIRHARHATGWGRDRFAAELNRLVGRRDATPGDIEVWEDGEVEPPGDYLLAMLFLAGTDAAGEIVRRAIS